MVLVRLQRFGPLADAIARLARIAKDADVTFTSDSLRFFASHRSPRFQVRMQMSRTKLFSDYFLDKDNRDPSRLSLESFHDALLDCTFCSSMIIHIIPKTTNQMLLRFETPQGECELRHEHLPLLPFQETDVEYICYKKYFTIKSQDLRRVIKELPIFGDDSVCITTTSLEVKFSVGSAEIIFTKKDGQCEIKGFRGDDETQIKIVLNPMLFFIDLTYEVNRVGFYKTIKNSYGVMYLPETFDHSTRYYIYFPQI